LLASFVVVFVLQIVGFCELESNFSHLISVGVEELRHGLPEQETGLAKVPQCSGKENTGIKALEKVQGWNAKV
jgi:hypothetical protein